MSLNSRGVQPPPPASPCLHPCTPKQKPWKALWRISKTHFSESRVCFRCGSLAPRDYRCGVFIYQHRAARKLQLGALQFQSCWSNCSRFPSSGASYSFLLLSPPLAISILGIVPLVTAQVWQCTCVSARLAPRYKLVGKNILIVCSHDNF